MKLLLLLCLLAAPLSAQWERHALQVVGSGLLIADTHSTLLERGFAIRETNVLLGPQPSRTRVVVYNAAVIMAYNYAMQKLPRRQARLLGLGMVALESYCVITNWRAIHRARGF